MKYIESATRVTHAHLAALSMPNPMILRQEPVVVSHPDEYDPELIGTDAILHDCQIRIVSHPDLARWVGTLAKYPPDQVFPDYR